MTQVAIIGCGPVGLTAALACLHTGHEPWIVSNKRKSEMFGAVYLHSPIPSVTQLEDMIEIDVIKVGNRQGYAQNVYGNMFTDVSWDKFEPGMITGWKLQATYDRLWDIFGSRIHHKELIEPKDISAIANNFDVIFNSIPADASCAKPDKHSFNKQPIWVQHGPANGIEGVNDGNMMYYNGLTPAQGGHEWYRFSQINGYKAWEYARRPPDNYDSELFEITEGFKPLKHDCDCFPTVKRIGRFGRWDKSLLTHHTYYEVRDALQQL